jgi:pimeloyl-ACP methyl ester carboxylesterase
VNPGRSGALLPPLQPTPPAVLYYRTYEHGPQSDWVVFVHGAGGSSAIWFKQIREFKQHFNVLLVDLRGHGHSRYVDGTPYSRKYTFEDVSRDVVEVLDHLSIEKAHFVGISLGSVLIRTLAEMAPDRVATMVLGGAITRLNFRSRFLVGVGNLFKRVLPYLWLYRLFAWIIMPRKNHREARYLFTREAKKLCQKEFLRWFKLTWRVNPVLKFFEERDISLPTLYLMGEEDHMFLPAVRRIVQRHAYSLLRVIDGAGHVCNVEQPGLFNRFAIEFIKAHPAAVPVPR